MALGNVVAVGPTSVGFTDDGGQNRKVLPLTACRQKGRAVVDAYLAIVHPSGVSMPLPSDGLGWHQRRRPRRAALYASEPPACDRAVSLPLSGDSVAVRVVRSVITLAS